LGVEEVKWGRNCTEPAGEYNFFSGKTNKNNDLCAIFMCFFVFQSCRKSALEASLTHSETTKQAHILGV
jgi:hypothetical protein